MGSFISVGNVIVDLVMRVPRMPEPGGDVIASGARTVVGGGLNTMVAARRDGARVVYAGLLGTGVFGDLARESLAGNGIQVLQPPVEGIDTGHCFAVVDDTGERTFMTHVGAEGGLGPAALERVRPVAGDTVFVSGYGLVHPSNAVALARWVPSLPAGVRVALDVGPLVDSIAPEVLNAVLRRTDVLTTNRREARLMAPSLKAGEAATEFARRWSLTAVVRDGDAGCWIADPGSPAVLVEGFEVTAVDTNGAGDTHDGVLLAGLMAGRPLVEAARRANAAAAVAVTRPGPATAPTGEEIDAFLAACR
ncbi:PfkB family carbohydrate kinase [Kineosporia succinea]|uniref:Sugar/nucleoside kinase (Ribokinase family) n=1 Tax=Kineosporia succinea TaxID=84632 RepID=A0ABT9PD03_9ACTN|nr:PfkB family carbohydrate kinase [Kineosporia succinea]MDP9830575.1 sugar/nucleoside kinase (ribokinase family) [Kineosporia succinea]